MNCVSYVKISNKYKMLEKASISPHHVEKLLRAYGECLGVKCRWRTWDTAISLGELWTSDISGDVRIGKPAGANHQHHALNQIGVWREPWELKHLSTTRKRDHSPSSGERTGISLNRTSLLVRGCRVRRLRVTKRDISRIGVGKPTTEGDSPVCENVESLAGYLSTTGHANPVGI